MYTNVQLLSNITTTATTGLRRVGGIHRDHLDSGLHSLVVKQITEHPQTHVVSRASELAILEHEVEVEVFEHYHTVAT